mgnify:CR=1 FL=1
MRELLGVLDMTAAELNVREFIRKELKDVESNRIKGQYSPFEVDEDKAMDCIDFVSNYLIPLVRQV